MATVKIVLNYRGGFKQLAEDSPYWDQGVDIKDVLKSAETIDLDTYKLNPENKYIETFSLAKQFTAMDVAEYIIGSYDQTFYQDDEEYYIGYDPRLKCFTPFGPVGAAADVSYAKEYLNDESPQSYFNETEKMNNPNFMDICRMLARKINTAILDDMNVMRKFDAKAIQDYLIDRGCSLRYKYHSFADVLQEELSGIENYCNIENIVEDGEGMARVISEGTVEFGTGRNCHLIFVYFDTFLENRDTESGKWREMSLVPIGWAPIF